MEVGPLARVLIMYAKGNEVVQDTVNAVLSELKAPLSALFSTLGRTAARGIECKALADQLPVWYDKLLGNIAASNVSVFDDSKFRPNSWPAQAQGVGYLEAPRGALAHWVVINNGRIGNYQAVVPTTWNAGPRDDKGLEGPYDAALRGHSLADPQQPLEILRTIHSFDPCMGCAVHLADPDGESLLTVRVK
jgi:hydrogenase large subunit